ncbi:MAG: hypothetical protein P4L84_07730 [Isosphaeraceae bacterium]|nr:hypothetical protein [Isosphaeraceae bacterium]
MVPPGLELEESGDCIAIEGSGLRFTFQRQGERWEHALSLSNGTGAVAASVEGDAARDDPARVVSPAYQEVHRHPADQGFLLLLTGQSGPHHYSAVVTARREGRSFIVEFDVADRCRSAVEVLAATYLVRMGSSDLVEAGPDGVVWGGAAVGQGRLEFGADASDSVALAEAGRCAMRVQALARIEPSTHTQRLHYRWRWTPAENHA